MLRPFSLAALGTAISIMLAAHGVTAAPTADDLMVVDCLLPGQLRQLGRRTTYLSARRPVKTTALDCRVRNGEYVLHDRANYKTALKVWLEQAQEGDSEAQTMVGEIFENGMGIAPDYPAAVVWYRRAAEANHTRAQINLGFLFEKGLGVAQDPRQALFWYRRAAGLETAIDLETTADVAPVNAMREMQIKALRDQIGRLESETATLRIELDDSRKLLQAPRPPPPTALAPEPVQPIHDAYQRELAALNRTVAERQRDIDNLVNEITLLRSALNTASEDATAKAKALAERDRTIADTQESLDETQADLKTRRHQLTETAQRLEVRERELSDQRGEAERLREHIASLQRAAAARQAQPPVPDVAQGIVAGPQIALIDPVLPRTRGLVKVSVPAKLTQRRIVGRVTAPAGLLGLTVNGVPTEPNAAGVFMADLAMTPNETDVVVTAIDQQGKRADLRFVLASQVAAGPAEKGPPKRLRDQVSFGRYHALLIGNDDYAHLPHLNTAINDVRRLDAILRERYEFETHLLTNATRYQILSALNELRGRLTTNDNLIIYYAGHGELDPVNMRGHWLPVDAEPGNTANWISNVAITDILNVIAAKHVLLIADSCYSGTLTRSSIARQEVALTDAERLTWLKVMAKKRARVVLTSGGLAPVLDSGGGAHSVFAQALLRVLEANDDLLSGRSLYQGVAARVAHAAANLEFEQAPEYSPIARAGHESGDFFLVPSSI